MNVTVLLDGRLENIAVFVSCVCKYGCVLAAIISSFGIFSCDILEGMEGMEGSVYLALPCMYTTGLTSPLPPRSSVLWHTRIAQELGGNSGEQVVDFHGWSWRSARCILRCIVQDLAMGKDFLLEMGQYDLGRAAMAQGLREFGGVSERWHIDSPDPRGRRRLFPDGAAPARFSEREYGKGRKRNSEHKPHWQKPVGGWDGKGSDLTQTRWWEKEKRLSLVVGRPKPPPCIRNSLEEFCMLGVTPPLRIRKDASNPGILTIEPEDVQAWLDREPTVLP